MMPVVTLLAGMLGSVVMLFFVRRTVGYRRLAESNDMAGAFFATVGTIYAVILAFMVFAVWSDFQEGEQLCDREANEIVTVARLTEGLPSEMNIELQNQLKVYTRAVIDDEWPQMDAGGESDLADHEMAALWPIVLRFEPSSERQKVVLDHTLAHLETLRQLRRSRLQRSREDLPPVLWSVLGFGGWVTLVCACLFGVSSGRLHAFQTAMLAGLLVFVLYAIAELKHPFQGRVRVQPTAFHSAMQQMSPGSGEALRR